jgi:UDP-glucose:(heptosyl)LPS alpha-1,3-glucosyltransferase
MKIALIILHADAARGGAERYTLDLARALAGQGHEVSLLARSFAGEVDGATCVSVDGGGLTRAGQYRRFLGRVDQHLEQSRYDIVHAMLPVRRCDIYHPHAGIAVEMSRPGDLVLRPRRRLMARTERALLTQGEAPLVIALSEYVKQSIRRHYALPDEKLATLFNAVDLERFDPGSQGSAKHRDDRCTALMIANDFERKGLGVAIEAAGKLGRAVRLVVVGKEDAGRYREMAARAQASVEFAGAAGDPRPFYRAADFFVLPTKHDPCSLVVLEALAMGLPVISTRFNGACEIMTNGEHGYVLDDPQDEMALAEAMRRMLDPQHRQAMRQACLALRPRLSYAHHLDELMRIYEQVNRRRRSAD